jgi:hypothetical protein
MEDLGFLLVGQSHGGVLVGEWRAGRAEWEDLAAWPSGYQNWSRDATRRAFAVE